MCAINLYEALTKSALFADIGVDVLPTLLICTQAHQSTYKKDELIIDENSTTSHIGIVLSGQCRAIKWDASGRVITITYIEEGSVMGVMLAAKAGHPSPVAVQATVDSVVLHIPHDRIIKMCKKNCPYHGQLIRNYIYVVAGKGLELYERINCLLAPSIRDKVMVYLTRISCEVGQREFLLPINKNGMAEYLNVERSALSRELSRMKGEAIIDYKRDWFRLL